jgi:hypothetical protein
MQINISRNELQQETDSEYTSAASLIQLISRLHNSVRLFYKTELKMHTITSPNGTTVGLRVLTVAIYRVDILPENYRLSLPVGSYH